MKLRIKQALKDDKGFTMIELMVVIVIILILAAIAIPSFNRMIDKANVTAATAEARTVLMLAQLEAETAEIDNSTIDDDGILAAVEAEKIAIVEDAGLKATDAPNFTFGVTAGRVKVTYTYATGKSVVLPE